MPEVEVRVIKRYANRKLYDTQHSRYVTLDQISEMIREGDDVKIIDNKSKEDLTSVTLAQIIFEEEKKHKSFLPLQTMRNIIQTGGKSIHHLVSQAQRKVSDILPQKEEEVAGDTVDTVKNEEVGNDISDIELLDKPKSGPLAIRELREFLLNSQKTIDEWQKRMDDRIRNVVEGIPPFRGIHKDVEGLVERIAELEGKLSAIVDEEETTID